MKKFRTIVAAAIMLFATSAFATPGPDKVLAIVKAEFEKDFSGAKKVTWEQKDDFYFASFILNSKEVSAAYNEKGELLGVSRDILTSQLPLNILMAISEKFAGYEVANNATEIVYGGQTSYYLCIEGDKKILKLKCNSDGELMVESKVKK